MTKNTKIQWTDMTWPITTGCERISPGCMNCYAIKDSWRLAHNPNPKVSEPYVNTVKKTIIDNQSVLNWTGIVKCHLDRLDWVTPRQKPMMVFVCNMSDLFHKNVPFEFIDRVWEQMAQCTQHTFQVLTKRPERMLEYFQSFPESRIFVNEQNSMEGEWPLTNVWLGTSTENQVFADQRVPVLLEIKRLLKNKPIVYLSMEPLCGKVRLKSEWLPHNHPSLDWIIAGGESHPSKSKARPCPIDLLRAIKEQCEETEVPFFLKQLGSRPVVGSQYLSLKDPKGGDMEEWSEDLRVRQFPVFL
ncbi:MULTISPECIES: DUF5131 family protein [unclassified Microcoleus]|uniref:DUF5131 family protein n=1 Tax=unclassified Microcoleus TaxID=2642155 RepID=UPI002FD49521